MIGDGFVDAAGSQMRKESENRSSIRVSVNRRYHQRMVECRQRKTEMI